uniref:Uncharacterized protein n=1 Tax=Anguilla anguilla TaxID=7936 RepID=A0A0E9QUP1_ANGAN
MCSSVFLHGDNSSIINCRALPWPTRPSVITELTSAFFLNDVQNC